MQRITSLSVSKMMLFLTASGFFVALAFAGPQIADLLKERRNLMLDATMTELASTIGDLTHEMQKERGASAGFLSSKGQNFVTELPAQRLKSDAAITAFLEAANVVEGELPADAPVLAMISDVRQQIDAVPDLRGRVDRLEIATLDAVGTITRLNRSAIGLLPELGKAISYADAARAVQRHAIFMTAKDISGLERATGAAAFARAAANSGEIPPALLDRFNTLVQEQDVLFQIYDSIASSALAEHLSALSDAPDTQSVAALRAIARSGDASEILGVTPEDWFSTITGKINLIKSIEDAGAAEISTRTSEAITHSRQKITQALSLLAVLSIVVGLAAAFLVRRVLTAIRMTADRVTSLANGDVENEIPEVTPSDLREITTALAIFRQGEMERRAELERQSKLELSSIEGIKRMTESVSSGDFAARLRLRDLQGASRILGEGVNEIMNVAERVTTEQKARDLAAIAQQQEIAEAGRAAVGELNAVVAACIAGDFSQRLRTDDKDGVFAQLCKGVNRIGEVTEEGLNNVMTVLDAIASGDLTQRLSEQQEGVFQDIGLKINRTSETLAEIVGHIAAGADTVLGSSEELSDAADDLAVRTEQAATALEKTSGALNDLTQSVTTTAEGVQNVGSAAKETEQEANAAVAAGAEMVSAMEGIAASSASISKITNVIDDIAFQTNLLALNAGVEAARAGDAGKGFAVVALEVRNLAQRAAEAASDINDLISKSETQVKSGVEIVENSRTALANIQNSITNMTRDVLQIVGTSTEQSRGIADINGSIADMENSTQQNAAMFEETQAVVQTMRDEAQLLARTVSHFVTSTPGVAQTAPLFQSDRIAS